MVDPVEYDRAPTMFSPDGRLLQVEYAKKTVKQGSSTIGIIYKDGALIVADKRILDPLIIKEAVEKIYEIDDHIIASAAGIISDARILMDYARIKAMQHRLVYQSHIDVLELVKEVSDIQQVYTQVGGHRPFGVSLIIAGFDSSPRLFCTDPVGIYFPYYAVAIGAGEEKMMDFLHKNYKENLSFEEALKLGINCLKEGVENLSYERIIIKGVTKDKKIITLQQDEIKKLLK
ncbi:MAG: archaeal proteasome endopeptidase complex subunit alpha [Candidatus Woesearchaeota archaeon]